MTVAGRSRLSDRNSRDLSPGLRAPASCGNLETMEIAKMAIRTIHIRGATLSLGSRTRLLRALLDVFVSWRFEHLEPISLFSAKHFQE